MNGVHALCVSLLLLGVFQVKYGEAWWKDNGADGNEGECPNYKVDKACSLDSDCKGGCDKIDLTCHNEICTSELNVD
ncbi:Hypothetical predicted protein [Paramuricea clavata]|uniref:Uncharacterized protein n=1 Tax=Paramuricea clavata TaxID=317549 RepID=A0A6S7I5K3_PARCT|nr:Hypothetical predicted protein [Paramuricea clavata]